jgi:3-oxoadipate enol-lactonase
MTAIDATRRRVQVGAASVSYLVRGEGPGLVLVHGTGADAEVCWSHLFDRLGAGRTLVAPDYAGSGQTTDDGRRLELADLAAQVAGAAADALGEGEPFDLVGFSLGAAVATHLAAERPGLVRSLVLLGGLLSTVGDGRAQVQFALWERLCEEDPDLFARLAYLTAMSPGFGSAMTPEQAREAVDYGLATRQPGTARQCDLDRRIDLTDALGRITARTLVFGQTRDAIAPVEESRALHAGIAGSAYVELDAGHLGLVEQPQAVADGILRFLDAPAGG